MQKFKKSGLKEVCEFVGEIEDNQFGELFNGILTEEISLNLDIQKRFFPNDRYGKQSGNNLKFRFIEFLSGKVLLKQTESGRNNELTFVYKMFSASKILIGLQFKKAGVFIAERTLKKAIKLEMSEIISSLSTELFVHYSYINPDSGKAKKYYNMAVEFESIYLIENKAIRAFAKIAAIAISHKSPDKEEIEVIVNEVKKHKTKNNTDKFLLAYYNMLVTWHHTFSPPSEIFVICENAICEFKERNHLRGEFSFMLKLIEPSIRLFDEKSILETTSQLIFLSKPGSYNWHLILLYKAIAGIWLQKKEMSVEAVRAMKKYRNKPSLVEEQMIIIKSYMHLIGMNGSFYPKFNQLTTSTSKDKKGGNINILIIRLLFALKQKNRDLAIDLIESTRIYVHRQLKYSNSRAKVFLQMLLQISPGGFNPVIIEIKVKKYKLKLEKASPVGCDLEIVPYDRLWSVTMSFLK